MIAAVASVDTHTLLERLELALELFRVMGLIVTNTFVSRKNILKYRIPSASFRLSRTR